jgi:hypothetical protein
MGTRTAGPAQEAARRVALVRDDPAGRLELMQQSYGADSVWARAEAAFMEWEVDRGVLNPLTGTQPGSAWWRSVNERLLRDAEEARLRWDTVATAGRVRPAVRHWMAFFGAPSSLLWYRAHNASVADGYLEATALAQPENDHEQTLMNLTLMRVLYVQALQENAVRHPGPLGRIERLLADPRSFGVDVVVKLPDFYPRHYPLDACEARRLDHRWRTPAEAFSALIDDDLVLPRLQWLYDFGANALGIPRLTTCAAQGFPCYPWSVVLSSSRLQGYCFDREHPWEVFGELRALFSAAEQIIDLR